MRPLRDRNSANGKDQKRKEGKPLPEQHRDGIGRPHGCPQNLERVLTATMAGPVLPASIVIQTCSIGQDPDVARPAREERCPPREQMAQRTDVWARLF